MEKLFKLFGFVRDTNAANTNGIGLGLMISKHLVEEYEGQIWVESEEGIGSKFLFKLKLIPDESN